jgi:hypothetical protein
LKLTTGVAIGVSTREGDQLASLGRKVTAAGNLDLSTFWVHLLNKIVFHDFSAYIEQRNKGLQLGASEGQ